MALRRFDLEAGGDSFAFKPETEPNIAFWLGKYPSDKKRSAVGHALSACLQELLLAFKSADKALAMEVERRLFCGEVVACWMELVNNACDLTLFGGEHFSFSQT